MYTHSNYSMSEDVESLPLVKSENAPSTHVSGMRIFHPLTRAFWKPVSLADKLG